MEHPSTKQERMRARSEVLNLFMGKILALNLRAIRFLRSLADSIRFQRMNGGSSTVAGVTARRDKALCQLSGNQLASGNPLAFLSCRAGGLDWLQKFLNVLGFVTEDALIDSNWKQHPPPLPKSDRVGADVELEGHFFSGH
jgi:hypothetical protein